MANVTDYDCFSQVVFEDIEHYKMMEEDPYYKEHLFEDHENFADTQRSNPAVQANDCSGDPKRDGRQWVCLEFTLTLPDPLHDGFGVKEGEYLPGTVVHDYLAEYAKYWNIYERIRFETKALETNKVEGGDGWHLTVSSPAGQYTLVAKKLIVATGLTSQPQALHVKGQDSYNASIVNTSQLATDGPALLKDPAVTRVTIVGTGKSAYDAVYTFANAGKQVDWVIRKDGHGPAWMSKSHIVLGPFGKFWVEHLVTRRFFAWQSPCLWGDVDGSGSWRHFLHRTWLGRKLSDLFWWKMSADTLDQSGFNDPPKLKALHPDSGMFSMATTFAILNYPTDILDFVRSGQVIVHRENVSHLADHTVDFDNGTKLESDAFVASMGWLFGLAVNFTDKSSHSKLGIPSLDYTKEEKAFWADLDTKADVETFRKFPKLAELTLNALHAIKVTRRQHTLSCFNMHLPLWYGHRWLRREPAGFLRFYTSRIEDTVPIYRKSQI
ncbi:hypothetical protein LTR17_022442 [Elasticomyces elasticus]|nr:hypothetical protein LTR17_022442 [Elasticomyces elasticus]